MPKIIDKKELSEKLKISERTIDRLRTKKKDPLPSFKLGGLVRFYEDKVNNWLFNQGLN
jgi:excisionase family DNA binding protein